MVTGAGIQLRAYVTLAHGGDRLKVMLALERT
jgi:hypothetical protein